MISRHSYARGQRWFRGEYIFDLEKAVVVETPQLGHATYVFAKPRSMEGFLVLYTRITKDDIRRNRDNLGERLGFLGRVIHGMNPRVWIREMRLRLGEELDYASAVVDAHQSVRQDAIGKLSSQSGE